MLSTPYFTIKSVAIAKVAPPDKGFMIIIGIISVGIQKSNDNGLNKFTLFSIIPEFFNIPMQINTPNKVGNIITAIFNPSFAPSQNVLKISIFSSIPNIITIKIIVGII